MLLAVPAIIEAAASTLPALRSGIFCSAILVICSLVMVATLVLLGTPEPLSIPHAFLSNTAAGGVLVLAGIALSIMAVEVWKTGQMGNLEPERIMRIVIPAVSFLIIGIQSICTGFVVGVMKVKTGATDEPD